MITWESRPELDLRDCIQSYFYYRIGVDEIKYFDIFPDGHFCLIINVKGDRIVDKRLTGIWTQTASISYHEAEEVLGISFHPIAIRGLFKSSLKNLLDSSIFIPSLSAFNLDENVLLKNLGDQPEVTHYLNEQFSALTANKQYDPRLKKCFELVNDSSGGFSVKEISQKIGLSTRQLNRLVTDMIGIGLKEYAKIIRLKKALVCLKKGRTFWPYYYDQAHFIRELKRYTSARPSDLDLNNDDRFIQYYYFG